MASSEIVGLLQGKNQALKDAGAIVPDSFEGLEGTVARVYQDLVADGTIQPRPEPAPPIVPQDLAVAQRAGLVGMYRRYP